MNKEKTWFYCFARAVITPLFRWIFRAKAVGVSNFPQNENCIILCNHISAWDPLTIAYFYSVSEIHFISKDSLFKNKLVAAVLKGLHAFPVARGETDMGAMRTAMQVLRDGHVLGIFPEGHRMHSDGVEKIETGIAVMALKSDVPLVPVMLEGKYKIGGKLRMAVGKPIPMEDLRSSRADAETLESVKKRIVEALNGLAPSLKF